MNGPHDLGGMHGYGPLHPEADEPVFHRPGEARLFALVQAMGAAGLWNIDSSRMAMENLPPSTYETLGYFDRWLVRAERMYQDHGLVTPADLEAGQMVDPARPVKGRLTRAGVDHAYATGASSMRPCDRPARFSPGARVRTVPMNPPTHTRLPRYARDKPGVVVAVYGTHVFPDSSAIGKGDDPQWLYAVRFDGRDLWGRDAEPGSAVIVDCWEPYLEPEATE